MKTLFQRKSSGKIYKWTIEVDGEYVVTTYGYVDGAIQTTREKALAMNVGRSNEITPKEQAILIAERKIKEKTDNGYSETQDGAESQNLQSAIDFDDLSVSFCPAKPISTLPADKLKQLWDSGRAIVQRKFDGLCHFYVAGSSHRLLSRGKLEDKASHVPHIMDELRSIPQGTILNGEICQNPVLGDDFKHVTSTLRHKTASKAIEKQNNGGGLHYIIFDVLYWNHEDVSSMPYVDRMKLFDRWKTSQRLSPKAFSLPTDLSTRFDFNSLFKDPNLAVINGWEGYVIWDGSESTKVRWDGKTARKNCYKWKATTSEDVWAEDPENGKGRNENRLGKVKGYQYLDGEKIYVGDIGGGFTDAEREELWATRDTAFPCVIEVETSERQPSMKLRFPVFSRLRPDKQEHECTVGLMPRNATQKDSQPSS